MRSTINLAFFGGMNMNLYLKLATVLMMGMSMTGCAYLGTTSRSYEAGSTGRLFVWDSKNSAGVGRDNAMCVQGAQTASANSFNAAVDIAEEISGGGGFGQSVIVLNPASPQTTYANNAYFAICQLAMNSSVSSTKGEPATSQLNGEQIVTMFGIASATAVQISNSPTPAQSYASPQLVNYVQSILRANNIEMSEEEISEGIQQAAEETVAPNEPAE